MISSRQKRTTTQSQSLACITTIITLMALVLKGNTASPLLVFPGRFSGYWKLIWWTTKQRASSAFSWSILLNRSCIKRRAGGERQHTKCHGYGGRKGLRSKQRRVPAAKTMPGTKDSLPLRYTSESELWRCGQLDSSLTLCPDDNRCQISTRRS